jgi:flavin-dependent dehydrogenase
MRVAVLGAGIAGSALATLLARRGAEVTLFDDGRRPELVVGESLVPAVVPILRRLGVEQVTATFSRVKPGVSFIWSATDRASFNFARFAPGVFPYAYNIPRPQFDTALLAHAVEAGASKVVGKARLERASGAGAEVALTAETLAMAPSFGGQQPDLIVDATGRVRHVARVLGIGADVGPRRDVAHFAHYEGFRWDDAPGQVLISRLAAGWSWCIPLMDRLSIGIVLGHDAAADLGRTPEDRLAQAIATDPWLAGIAADAKRLTSVATYSNYQLVSQRTVGPGWVMVGDAFGFVDPMLSPGVFLALHSAETVADALSPLLNGRTPPSPRALVRALEPYTVSHAAALKSWTELVAYLYDGRLLALMRAGRDWMERGSGPLKNAMQDHIEKHIALQASGMGTMSRYSRGLLSFLGRHGLRGVQPSELAIR